MNQYILNRRVAEVGVCVMLEWLWWFDTLNNVLIRFIGIVCVSRRQERCEMYTFPPILFLCCFFGSTYWGKKMNSEFHRSKNTRDSWVWVLKAKYPHTWLVRVIMFVLFHWQNTARQRMIRILNGKFLELHASRTTRTKNNNKITWNLKTSNGDIKRYGCPCLWPY